MRYVDIRRILWKLEPERVHGLTLGLLSLAGSLSPVRGVLRRWFVVNKPELRVQALGLQFANPMGLAAGYDKDGRAIHGLAALGFGHLELGTVTPDPQPGNPKPRVFRLPEDEALINRMGFPNEGANPLIRRLRRSRPPGVILGVNIGKGFGTPIEQAAEDYVRLLRAFYSYADYLAVNVSSPNTPGLRRLQGQDQLAALLQRLSTERGELEASVGRHVPILVKLAPDLAEQESEGAVDAIVRSGMDGIIACNTTTDRQGLHSPRRSESGGLSGAPLRAVSTRMVRRIHRLTGGKLPIVGVGGVFGCRDAREKLDAGATLVQIYTGLVFRGPGVVREILLGLSGGQT